MTMRLRTLLCACVWLLLSGCGGGGGEGGPTAVGNPLVVSGLAATGAAMANSVVSVKCSTGATVSGVTAADGSFNLNLRGGQALPCMVKVTRGDPELTLYSLATTQGRVNVTPLTDLALARALGSDPATAFPKFNAAAGAAVLAALPGAKTYVTAQVQGVTGLAPAQDLMSGLFQIGDADDQILDAFGQAMQTAGLEMDELRTLAASGGDLKDALAVHPTEPDDAPAGDAPGGDAPADVPAGPPT